MPERSSTAPLIAGFTGGAVATALLFPLDIIKVRLQVSEASTSAKAGAAPKPRLGAMRILGGIVKHEGIRGLYSGFTPSVIGSAVSWGGYFFFYEGFKRRLVEYRVAVTSPASSGPTSRVDAASVLNSFDNFVLACGAGGLMVMVTNPIWLVKTRMQLQMRKTSEKHNIQPYKGTLDAFRTIVKEEGYLALYRGSGPAMLLTSHGGVQFAVYEYLRKHFHFRRAKRDDASSVWERLELSAGYLTMGAVAKM
jgi:solute carrier family 25 folate transporter 32